MDSQVTLSWGFCIVIFSRCNAMSHKGDSLFQPCTFPAITCQSLLPCCLWCLTHCCTGSCTQMLQSHTVPCRCTSTRACLAPACIWRPCSHFSLFWPQFIDSLMQRGPAQHVARYGGNIGSETWSFWVDLQACTFAPSHAPHTLLTTIYI